MDNKELMVIKELDQSFKNNPHRGLLCLAVCDITHPRFNIYTVEGYITFWEQNGDTFKVIFNTYEDVFRLIDQPNTTTYAPYEFNLWTHRMSNSYIRNIVISSVDCVYPEDSGMSEVTLEFVEGVLEPSIQVEKWRKLNDKF